MSQLGDGGFQGFADTSSSSSSANSHLQAVLERKRQREAAEAARRASLAARNLTGSGRILDTNKPVIGGRTNIPDSKFNIIGGRATSKANTGRNITSSIPSIRTRDGRRLTASSPNLTSAQKQALGIFEGQHAVTRSAANQFSSERRAQQLSGKSIAEANRIASGVQTNPLNTRRFQDRQIGVSKFDANAINTALQTDIIRSNHAKLNFAEELIANQTDTNRSLSGRNATTELDDLEGLLASAPNQDAPINRINVQGDEFGELVSPRNVRLQIENAGFTGGLTSPTLNVVGSQGTMPSVEEVAQVLRESLADVTGNAEVSGLTSVTQLPDGTLAIDFSEEAPAIFRQQFGDAIFESLGRYFDLKDQGVEDFFDDPEGLRIKIGEEEIQVGGDGSTGGGGFASGLLDNQGFDILGLLTNPIVLIGIAAVAGLVIFTKVRK